MFSSSRDPRGGLTLLISGIALLLVGSLVPALLPPVVALPIAGVCVLIAVGCAVSWWRQRKVDRYDLSRLWDSPPADPVDPAPELLDDFPQADELSGGLYCAWCDEAHPEGTHRCRGCGRPLI